ncbi:hypothetical protein D1BOALGB6SA_997 [Olavius sp. associated proteobacterium Delta 1]|nr:hypothetical protein D1BOALGB6SA_997 [Olavius sp. associated proteobacterium Delta 1]
MVWLPQSNKTVEIKSLYNFYANSSELKNLIYFQKLSAILERLLVEILTIIVIYYACNCHTLIVSE